VTDQPEGSIRRQLAAAYRLASLFGWDDHVATHLSARLSDDTYLINPYGLMFDEITASSLVRIDMDGNVVQPAVHAVNPAGTNIHGGLLNGRSDINSVMHLHTREGVAVSALNHGLLPLNQNALNIYHDIGYHAFEGTVTAAEERERLLTDLGNCNLMILRNHGTLTVGRSIASAFYRLCALEWACSAQDGSIPLRSSDSGLPCCVKPNANASASMNNFSVPAQ
jgi:ribulose-5-phosphate 4-epimerase/fuculose-1-phosphate aldolase